MNPALESLGANLGDRIMANKRLRKTAEYGGLQAENHHVVAVKRKAVDEPKVGLRVSKRAAFGERTNEGTSSSHNERKGKIGPKSKPKKSAAAEKQKEEASYGESESSTEIIACVFDSSSSSGEKTDFTIISPPRPSPPEGVVDFDEELRHDPIQHGEYARDTFQYYKNRVDRFKIPNYMGVQKDLNQQMRAILVDWMVEVQESFELNHETLYTAVKAVDLYLSKKLVKRENLQLVGATATFLASKVDERIPPLLDDFVYVCSDAYSRKQMIAMERKMLSTVGFDVGYPLSYRFLRRFARVCKVGIKELTLARFILESSLLEYSFNVELSECVLAASVLVLAFKIRGVTGYEKTLEYYSGLSIHSLKDTITKLHAMIRKPDAEHVQTVRNKYSHPIFHEVALIPVPETIDL